jgi:hypothetical protein
MPAEGIHLTSLREARASTRLPSAARAALLRFEDEGRAGAVVLDLPYFDRYAAEVARYALGLSPRPSPFGSVVHERAAVSILVALVDAARRARSDALAAVALGVASHATIDRTLHPLINALAVRHADGLGHDASHREVEKFQSICFHEGYYGRDRMGTPGIVSLVYVPLVELFASSRVGPAVAGAFAAAMTPAPSLGELRAMGRGYEQHAWLLGSLVGKRVATEAAKERARPRFMTGPWGTFESALERAIARSVPSLELTWALYEASDADAPAARAALLEALPGGSIDETGPPAMLDRPF